MSDGTEPSIKSARCAECDGVRKCDVRALFVHNGSDDSGVYDFTDKWYLLQCRGCDYCFALKESTDSEDIIYFVNDANEEDSDYAVTTSYWPALIKRAKPDWMLPSGVEGDKIGDLREPMTELYKALDADLTILSGIGIRSCFDIASELLGVDPSLTFEKKLIALVEKSHIREAEKERMDVLVEAGNGTTHRKWKPSTFDINVLMEVLESFLYEAFVIPHRKSKSAAAIAKLKSRIPAKVKKASPIKTLQLPSDKDPAS